MTRAAEADGLIDDDRSEVSRALDELIAGPVRTGAAPMDIWRRQFDLGLAWVDFPRGSGGLGLPPAAQRVINDRLAEFDVPSPAVRNQIGVGLVAPTLVSAGTPDQCDRYLRPCFTTDEIWCQLFSEPGAGSDLANLSTSAVRGNGDDWLVSGQKIWTSFATTARRGLLLARTAPDRPKHRGITCFAVDLADPGVSVRPIVQLNGYARFSEVRLDGVRIADLDRIGPVDEGWGVALAALGNERVMLAGRTKSIPGQGHVERAVETWSALRERDSAEAARHLDDLTRLWVRAEAARLMTVRTEQARTGGSAGPEAAVGKLVAAELEQDIYDLCLRLLGPGALEYPGYAGLEAADYLTREYADVRSAYLSSRRTTIAGGTSEIMRNLLAERVLGLPAEPRVDKNLPWNQTRRG
jgi:alkylation response protein AidB-like acyl-CoA dehydrogenase